MCVLIAEERKEFIFLDGRSESTASRVAVQAGDFLVGGNVRVGVVEEGRGIESVSAASNVETSVIIIRTGGGTHINVSATAGSLLRVVHRSVDAKLFDRLWSGTGKSLTYCKINGSGGLNDAAGGLIARAGVVDDACGRDLAGALAVEKIAGVDAVEQKCVASVALSVGPDGLAAQSTVDASASGEFGIDAGRQYRETSEAASGQRHGLNLGFFEDVAVRCIHSIEQRRRFNRDGGTHLADFWSDVDGGGAVGLHGDRGKLLRLKSVVRKGQGVGPDGEINEIVAASVAGLLRAREFCRVGDQRDRSAGERAARRVDDRAGDAAECLLRK